MPHRREIGVVVVTHGQLATELLNAAEMIVGDLPRFVALSIGWHDEVSVAREALSRAIERVRDGGAVLILTDMFGGTPSNLALSFLETGTIEVVTGVNLAMLIKLARAGQTIDLLGLARELCEDGREAIRVASDLLRSAPHEMYGAAGVSVRQVVVVNRLGMHARAAAKFVQLASRFRCAVRVTVGATTTDGKSILGLLLLAAAQGTTMTIDTDGADADEALSALVGLVTRGFEES